MWKLYSSETDGIAVKTDCSSFKRGLITNSVINIGRVDYIDYALDGINLDNTFNVLLHKRHNFEHEREVRAMYRITSDDNLSQDGCDIGEYFEVDLSLLIKEIIVAPYADNWLLELIQSVATRYGLKAPVNKSSLADKPKWDPGFPVPFPSV